MITLEESRDLFEQAKKIIPGGVHSPAHAFLSVGVEPFITDHAEGAYLYTIDGREFIDFVGSFGPMIHGHSHPVILAKMQEALVKGTSFATSNRYAIELSQMVVDKVPSIEKVRMVNSGTEATMTGLRAARGFTGRDKIVKFEGCYHGHYDGLLVKAGSGAMTFGSPTSAGVPAAIAGETLVLKINDIEGLEEMFRAHGHEIAAVIIEPYAGNCGFIPSTHEYLKRLREICTEYGTVLIFDEVMTGFRLAMGGVQEIEGIVPDMTALGKIIGGGMPVGAIGGRAEIMDCLSPLGKVYQAGTLSGNPVAMAAGLASLRLLELYPPYRHLEDMGKMMKDALMNAAREKGIAIQVPQIGSMFSMFFNDNEVKNYDDALKSNVEYFKKLFRYAYDRGIFLPPSPYETCFISTAHDGKPLERAIEILSEGIYSL